MLRQWKISVGDTVIMSLRIGASVHTKPYHPLRYPQPGDSGIFTLGCSCGRWQVTGSAEDCIQFGREHDDSPFKNHIVSVVSREP